ncbi:ABC transporter substrate-binding protein [Halobacteriales archaeon QS_8_69_26]|nr:MAG: ABC transporter substrate-binding protein [Halobacteriales archaeon QS_8_69_26]
MSRKKRRRSVLKGIGIAGMAGLAGCLDGGGGGDDEETTTDDGGMETTTEADMGRELRMGILMGVSGGLAQLGPPIRNSAQLVADYINDESDTFSVDTQFEDTATDPNTGISGAEALVNAGYPMVAGALSSTVTIQTAQQVLIPNGVVQCSPASTSPAITGLEDNDYVYRTTPTDALQSQVMAQVGRERLEAETTSILGLNNDYGQGLAEAYASAWEERGGSVQTQVAFEPGKSSYSAELSQALSDQPDLLMIVGYPESGVNIFRDFYDDYSQDFCDIIVPDGLKDSELPGNVGNSMRNVWGTAPLSSGPGSDFFESLYQEEYGEADTPFRPQSFDAAAVMCLANAAAGENNGEAVRDEMRNVANPGGTEVTPENLVEGLEMAASGEEINYQGAAGVITFDENGDVAAATYELFRYQEGGLETIDEILYEA